MELEKLVSLARQEKDGVLGACMTGGGFGGCTVTLLRSHALASTKQRIEVYTDYSGTSEQETLWGQRFCPL